MKKQTAILVLGVLCLARPAKALEGRRADSVLLNGAWQFALGDGTEKAHQPGSENRLDWQPVTLPGQFVPWSEHAAAGIKFVWVRRTFDVSKAQAQRLGVLRWDRILHGATAYINGKQVGSHEPTGPFQVLVPPGTIKPGRNQIVLKIAGAAGVHKARSGHFLFPAGQIWGPSRPQMPAVTQDIWIDFADRAYMKWVLAIPDLAGSKVRLRVTPTGVQPLDALTVSVHVRPWPDGPMIGSGEASTRLVPNSDPVGGEHCIVEVPMPGFKPWTPEECNLYTAEVRLMHADSVLDTANVRFGMRAIKVVEGDYRLNGKRLWIRGSNLVHEWDWADVITGHEKTYLVTEAREMSINAFRTHTQPPPRLWADICDENGTMILAEFPVLYNYREPRFTAEEWAVFHRNALIDTAGWMQRLWNHPSVIMWVLSNESRKDNEWEAGPFRDFVVGLDPTRPTMRTGTTGTKTNYDVHTCGNTNHWTHEGQMQLVIDGWFRQAQGRTVTNSEYMNIFRRPKCQWTGTDDEQADRLAYAQIGMEHTEAMRRARVDAMLPYMYAGWTRTRRGEVWKAGFAQPVSAAWHSALSPVLASLDLFDANYLVDQKVTTDLYLINDSWHDARIHVDLLLTTECPEFIPEAACLEHAVAQWSHEFTLKADSVEKTPVTWTLPDRPGSYWLTARTTGIAGRPVLSQRFVRAVRAPVVPSQAQQQAFVLLGNDDTGTAYFRDRGLNTSTQIERLDPKKHVVVIWNPANLSASERRSASLLDRFAADGGRVVVLSTDRWDWKDLCNVTADRMSGSRVFPQVGSVSGPGLATTSRAASGHHWLLDRVDPDCLKRWNGLPGTVAAASLKGPAVEAGTRLLWVREPQHTVVAEIPTAQGDGSILFCQLDLRRHILRSTSTYDPVAEQILINLLSRGP